MKLKYKIALLPCISSLLLVVVFLILILIQKARIGKGVTEGDALNSLFWWSIGVGLVVLLITMILTWIMSKKIIGSIFRISSIFLQQYQSLKMQF